MDGIESTKLETEDRCLLGPQLLSPLERRRASEARAIGFESRRERRRYGARAAHEFHTLGITCCECRTGNADDVRNGMRPISA
jgi:hypothetical protein